MCDKFILCTLLFWTSLNHCFSQSLLRDVEEYIVIKNKNISSIIYNVTNSGENWENHSKIEKYYDKRGNLLQINQKDSSENIFYTNIYKYDNYNNLIFEKYTDFKSLKTDSIFYSIDYTNINKVLISSLKTNTTQEITYDKKGRKIRKVINTNHDDLRFLFGIETYFKLDYSYDLTEYYFYMADKLIKIITTELSNYTKDEFTTEFIYKHKLLIEKRVNNYADLNNTKYFTYDKQHKLDTIAQNNHIYKFKYNEKCLLNQIESFYRFDEDLMEVINIEYTYF